MLFRNCPFCHKKILWFLFKSHCARHTARGLDGQMQNHVTVHPSGRYQGSLEGVPQIYFHAKCGVGTGMPESIIRSYLVNPFLYNGRTFCCGCNDYVSASELVWTETGQNMGEYNSELQRAYIEKYGSPP